MRGILHLRQCKVKYKIETSNFKIVSTYSLFQWYKFDDDVVSQVRGFPFFFFLCI